MTATLKTTNIQEPSSSTVNITLPSSGGGVTINGTTSGGGANANNALFNGYLIRGT